MVKSARMRRPKGWEILVHRKDGRSARISLKDTKNSYPSQISGYAVQRRISGKPKFSWWIQHVLRKFNWIIGKVKYKYWVCSNKFGVKIPKYVAEKSHLTRIMSKNSGGMPYTKICRISAHNFEHGREASKSYQLDTRKKLSTRYLMWRWEKNLGGNLDL